MPGSDLPCKYTNCVALVRSNYSFQAIEIYTLIATMKVYGISNDMWECIIRYVKDKYQRFMGKTVKLYMYIAFTIFPKHSHCYILWKNVSW